MKILIGAFGTHGDVQPMAALAPALEARGHTVRVAVPPSSLEFAVGLGLDAFAVGLNYADLSHQVSTGNFHEVRAAMPLLRGELSAQLEGLRGPAEESDVLVGASAFTVGSILSEGLRKPYVFFCFSPQLLPSAVHPMPGLPFHGLPQWMNRLSWAACNLTWRRLLGDATNAARADLKLPPIRDLWRSLTGDHAVVASDAALAEVPEDSSPAGFQSGALFLDEKRALSREVEAFLARGEPPVYLGFGSMSDPSPKETTARLVAAVRQAGARAIVSRGWAGLESDDADDLLVVGSEPHQQLFPRCAAVVHHGGAGTTHAAARSGVPQVLMPQIFDQHYWAHHIARRRIGFSVARHAVSPAQLAAALRACLTDRVVRDAAKTLAGTMRTDGVARAVDFVERLAMSGSSARTDSTGSR